MNPLHQPLSTLFRILFLLALLLPIVIVGFPVTTLLLFAAATSLWFFVSWLAAPKKAPPPRSEAYEDYPREQLTECRQQIDDES